MRAHPADLVGPGVWLEVWERTASLPPARRHLQLLRTACLSRGPEELERLTVGERDRLLLELREALFGAWMVCTTPCPDCSEQCEWSCSVSSLCDQTAAGERPSLGTAGEPCADIPGVYEWSDGPWRVRFRAVNSADLISLSDCLDESTAADRLLGRCVLEAVRDGRSIQATDLPAEVIDELAAAMEQADGQAALQIALACPDCAHRWTVDFDPGEFLWAELDAWAQRILVEVHLLAGRYGWSEQEILSMTPTRRARYLAMGAA